MPISQRNGLYVVEAAADFKAIDAALYEVDDHLFLTWEIRDGAKVYRVMFDRGDEPPVSICDWTNEYGKPLPLSSSLIERVKSLRPRGTLDFKASQKANEAMVARQVADFDAAVDEMAADIGPRIEGRRSPAFHRGIHLRRARAGG